MRNSSLECWKYPGAPMTQSHNPYGLGSLFMTSTLRELFCAWQITSYLRRSIYDPKQPPEHFLVAFVKGRANALPQTGDTISNLKLFICKTSVRFLVNAWTSPPLRYVKTQKDLDAWNAEKLSKWPGYCYSGAIQSPMNDFLGHPDVPHVREG